jgi:hypothetical protein
MTLPPPELRRLVRRDVRLAAGSVTVGLAAYALMGASWLGWVDRRAAATVVASAAALVAFTCFTWWLPGLIALRELGGGLAIVLFSSVIGFSAAVTAGYAWTSRRGR